MPVETLWAHHQADLRSSGLTDATIQTSRCYSATEPTTRMLLGFGVGPGLVFPFPGATKADGSEFCQVKPDTVPQALGKARYVTPKESGCRLYVPPILDPVLLSNPKRPLYLTEGCKKALKATQDGLPTLAFAGVDAWRDRRNGTGKPIPELDLVIWKARTVYIVYDSDLAWKLPVRWAEFRLARELHQRGAKVFTVRLPSNPDGSKVGFDDYLVTHSVEVFCAIEPEAVEHPEKPGAIVQFSSEPLGDFLEKQLPVLPDIVGDGVITQSSLISLVGRAKLGKTWILTQLGLTVAGLSPSWLVADLPVKAPGRVMYVNAEVAEVIFQRRLRTMLEHAEKEGELTGPSRRQFFPVSVRGQMRLDRKAGEEQILRLADKIKPILIILDPIGPLHSMDENSAEEMGKLLNVLLSLCARTGAAIVFAHHAPKNTEGREGIHLGRGSSVFGDRVDSMISLVPTGDQSQASRLRMAFVLRNGPPRDCLILTKEHNECLYHASAQVDDLVKWMLSVVKDEEEIDRVRLKEKFTESGYAGEFYFRQASDRLVKSGLIEKRKDGFPAKTIFRYRSGGI